METKKSNVLSHPSTPYMPEFAQALKMLASEFSEVSTRLNHMWMNYTSYSIPGTYEKLSEIEKKSNNLRCALIDIISAFERETENELEKSEYLGKTEFEEAAFMKHE